MENKKDAVNIGVTLSTQLISASLTMIAVLGAFATFIIDKREVGLLFYVLIGISFLAFIKSIFWGAKGIDKARKSGFDGKWNLDDTKKSFNWQALSCVMGLLFFILSIFIGKEKSDTQLDRLLKTENDICAIQLIDSLRQLEVKQLKEEIKLLNRQLEDIKVAIKMDTVENNNKETKKKITRNLLPITALTTNWRFSG
jgi:hypothetical protein